MPSEQSEHKSFARPQALNPILVEISKEDLIDIATSTIHPDKNIILKFASGGIINVNAVEAALRVCTDRKFKLLGVAEGLISGSEVFLVFPTHPAQLMPGSCTQLQVSPHEVCT